jgi:predicted RNA-binding protein with PUA-like domain
MKEKKYWLLKSEPGVFSITDLENCPKKTTCWDGVRNFQARNYLRDALKPGDLVFFYHSNADPSGIAGIAEVVKAGYPDSTAFDPEDHHFDPKSNPAQPTWYMVDVRHVKTFRQVLSLSDLRAKPELQDMVLLQKGSQLSVQPVTARQWQTIVKMAG